MAYFNNPYAFESQTPKFGRLEQPTALPNRMSSPSTQPKVGSQMTTTGFLGQSGGSNSPTGGVTETNPQDGFEEMNSTKSSNSFGVGDAASLATVALNAYGTGTASQADPGNFAQTDFNGISGAVSGASAGGWIGAIVGSVAEPVAATDALNKKIKRTRVSEDYMSRDAYGKPLYNGQNAINAIHTRDALSSGLTKTQDQVNPLNIHNDFFNDTRGKLKKQRNIVSRSIAKGQNDFNTQRESFEKEQAGAAAYRRRRDITNRLYNLYSTPQTFSA